MENTIQNLDDLIKEKETQIDLELKNLGIWKENFQAVYLSLLYNAEYIDYKGSGDSPMDYFARIASMYKMLASDTVPSAIEGTWSAISTVQDKQQFSKDVQVLYAYSHFSMIMPQIHRGVFRVAERHDNTFKLDYRSKATEEAEIKDKLLSILSQQMSIQFPQIKALRAYLQTKVKIKNMEINEMDNNWIGGMYNHHLQHMHRVHVLTDDVLEQTLGFNNQDYKQFTAALVAFSEFLIELGRTHMDAVDNSHPEDANLHAGEHMEWTACSLDYAVLDTTRNLSGLAEDKFNTLLSYYSQIYDKAKDPKYVSRAMCGDGFLPPFLLGENTVMFSPLALRHYHPFGNILYAVNKRQQLLFNNKISQHLEPVLINQTDQLFKAFLSLKTQANVHFPGGEVDYMVLSESEKVCLCFQVKATLTPMSSRTVERVEDRSLEGCSQIDRFEALQAEERDSIINNAFGTALTGIKIISILLVRSSAGSERVWSTGKNIVNYNLLAGILSEKKRSGDSSFSEFHIDIEKYFTEMLALANPAVAREKFAIQDVSIDFPDVNMNDLDAKAKNWLQSLQQFPNFENAE